MKHSFSFKKNLFHLLNENFLLTREVLRMSFVEQVSKVCEESKENSVPEAAQPPDDAVFSPYQAGQQSTTMDLDLSCLLDEEAKNCNAGTLSFTWLSDR